MAEGRISLCAASDVRYDYFCEICIDTGRQLEAEGFCVDCGEYLCGSCYNGHKRTDFTRRHVLQDKTSMPKDTPLSQDRAGKDIASKCKTHSGELMRYYCISHRFLGCSTCFVEDHKGCRNITSIAKVHVSENILDSTEYNGFVNNLHAMTNKSRHVEQLAHDNKTTSQRWCEELVTSVRLQTEAAISILRGHEKNIVALAEQIRSDEEKRLDSILKERDVMSEKTEQLCSTFDSLQSSKRVRQLFIAMTQTEAHVAALQQNIDQLEADANVVKTCMFDANVDLTSFLLRSPDVLGTITHETHRNVTATTLGDLDVSPYKLSDDTDCKISGSAVVNGKLLTADHNNDKLNLTDINTNVLTAILDVPSSPWDVAAINQCQAVVTFPHSQKILVVTVTDTLVKEREINVSGDCYGVAYIQAGLLLVTYRDNPRLEILDMYGTVIRTIENDRDGRQLFTWPYYACVSKDKETVYVSDYHDHTVTSLTLDGVVKAVYKDTELTCPGKVCTDHHGNVYVCGSVSNNVHMLTANCNKAKVILSKVCGPGGLVLSVSHCQDTNRLFVGMQGDIVKSYQLS